MNKESQCTDTVLMVRPANFGFNDQTAHSNSFQHDDQLLSIEQIQRQATQEFNLLVDKLVGHGLKVVVVDDSPNPVKPDAIFPNNWFSTHSEGILITYPLFTPNRRTERREDIIAFIENKYKVKQRYSFEGFEEEGLILESTGSMVLDRENQIVYACISPRTDPALLDRFALLRKYDKVVFKATDPHNKPVYHTNVIMAIGRHEVVLCTECIQDELEKKSICDSIRATGKNRIEISWAQVLKFAGNMLQVINGAGDLIWLMSTSAYDSLDEDKKLALQKHARILHSPIPTIEKYGGGSVRCMIAELFLAQN